MFLVKKLKIYKDFNKKRLRKMEAQEYIDYDDCSSSSSKLAWVT